MGMASVVQVVVTMTMRLVIMMLVMKSMALLDFTNDSGGSGVKLWWLFWWQWLCW